MTTLDPTRTFYLVPQMTIDVSKVDNKEVIAMLINHFNYSIKDIRSYEELTDSEKKFIPKKLWDKIVLN